MTIRFACPFCKKHLSAPDERAGAQAACPGCRNQLIVPSSIPPELPSGVRLVSGLPTGGTSSMTLMLVGGLAGGLLLMSCCMCGIIGMFLSPSSPSSNIHWSNEPDSTPSGDFVRKADGTIVAPDEERRQAEKFGPKPDYSRWDGSYEEVKKYLEENLNDPNSVEYVFWSKVVLTDNGWSIRLKYRAKNAFGGVITKDQIFTVRNGVVVGVRDR